MKFTVKEVEFESNLTDEQARSIILNNQFRTAFADSIANARNPSEKQRAWMHKLALEMHQPKAADPALPSLAKLVAFFDHAATKLKWPKITCHVLAPVKVTRHPQHMHLVVREGENVVCRVARDGTLTRRPSDAVLATLIMLNDDPANIALMHGQRFSNCCFCGRELTCPGSIAYGYGPVCADRWGLPWAARVDGSVDEELDGVDVPE